MVLDPAFELSGWFLLVIWGLCGTPIRFSFWSSQGARKMRTFCWGNVLWSLCCCTWNRVSTLVNVARWLGGDGKSAPRAWDLVTLPPPCSEFAAGRWARYVHAVVPTTHCSVRQCWFYESLQTLLGSRRHESGFDSAAVGMWDQRWTVEVSVRFSAKCVEKMPNKLKQIHSLQQKSDAELLPKSMSSLYVERTLKCMYNYSC